MMWRIPSEYGASAMRRDKPARQNHLRTRIAAAAARMMAEDGIDDFATAKRKAAKAFGAFDTQSLPGNDEIEAELRTYLALFRREEHADRLAELRAIAVEVMQELAAFRPYLAGAVLKGIPGRYADIDLQVFAENPKAVELHLINGGIPYETGEQRFWLGDDPRSVSVLTLDWHGVPVNVAVFEARDERSPLKTTPAGKPMERAALAAVRELAATPDATR